MRVKWKALAISRYERMEEYRLSAQRLADACKAAREANNCTPDVDKKLDEALSQWKGGAK